MISRWRSINIWYKTIRRVWSPARSDKQFDFVVNKCVIRMQFATLTHTGRGLAVQIKFCTQRRKKRNRIEVKTFGNDLWPVKLNTHTHTKQKKKAWQYKTWLKKRKSWKIFLSRLTIFQKLVERSKKSTKRAQIKNGGQEKNECKIGSLFMNKLINRHLKRAKAMGQLRLHTRSHQTWQGKTGFSNGIKVSHSVASV